jgi:hypothetical protein
MKATGTQLALMVVTAIVSGAILVAMWLGNSLLIVVGLAKDPWDEDDDTLARRLADERGT